ncbi:MULTISPECIES: DUF3841 domain-containing protein [unclassified Halanaerobium]|uniref:DUF3841 domain-containing protein n=1 Tax=unclassified Halanaerobium TaxID=2641197 RepID=UPI000DF4895B|nr:MULTISPECIES: DUF3841 domain-containing protein [unclassified Halanaerobium]RCW46344.1 uncharacterized protein DUF3841 [Halanaerobium sp. MA284_MarDTE_T2]RCW82533.1 uncharacterized protein DUF3841 [Halanaerobium sp. DL-01]
MSTKVKLWTQQSKKVKDLLFKEKRLTVKKRYIKRKYGSEAEIFLKAYDFFVSEAKKIVQKPEDAEYPFWAAADPKSVLNGGGGFLIKLQVPKEKIIFFDKKKWNKILNLSYIADDQKDLEEHQKALKKWGITDDSEVMLSPYYPVLKNKIRQSWQKLFESENDGFNSAKRGAAVWVLCSEWVEKVIKN